MQQASSSSSALPLPSPPLGSPPPYSPEPPAVDTESPFLARRAASSPHLQSPPHSPRLSHVYPQSFASSRRPSASALPAQSQSQLRPRLRSQSINARIETDDDDTDTALSGEDAVSYRPRSREQPREQPREQRTWTLRERLFGKGKGRADATERVRFITTARGMVGAGETETESDDAVSVHTACISIVHWKYAALRRAFSRCFCCRLPCKCDTGAPSPT